MATVDSVLFAIDALAPQRLAEEWDNVGLLVGRRDRTVDRIMTCLTLTPAAAAEAVREQADVVVSHHPLPFRPLQRLTSDSTNGRVLMELIEARIAVISPHTAFDSAITGINFQIARGMGLEDMQPLVPLADNRGPPSLGAGRWGRLPVAWSLGDVAQRAAQFFGISQVQVVGDLHRQVRRVAIACGSGGEFLGAAKRCACDCLITGEARFHTCLEAEAEDVGLVLSGHFASERFAVEWLAEHLRDALDMTFIWASRSERDPLQWVGK